MPRPLVLSTVQSGLPSGVGLSWSPFLKRRLPPGAHGHYRKRILRPGLRRGDRVALDPARTFRFGWANTVLAQKRETSSRFFSFTSCAAAYNRHWSTFSAS